MKDLTVRQREYTRTLTKILDKYPKSHKVSEIYKVMEIVITQEYPSLAKNYSTDTLKEIIRDIVHIDRKLRKMTEGEDVENKKRLSQEYQMEVLGYESGYHENVKKLKNKVNEEA